MQQIGNDRKRVRMRAHSMTKGETICFAFRIRRLLPLHNIPVLRFQTQQSVPHRSIRAGPNFCVSILRFYASFMHTYVHDWAPCKFEMNFHKLQKTLNIKYTASLLIQLTERQFPVMMLSKRLPPRTVIEPMYGYWNSKPYARPYC